MRVFRRAVPAAVTRFLANRELVVALAAAWLLVVLRNLVFLVYEHSFFDSDQAIFGLMAQHLVEGRAFPLFCYGQNYMLAVDAWVAAAVFTVTGPSVASLHAALVVMNLVAVTVLVVLLSTAAGLRPLYALAAASLLAFVPPVTAATLLEPAGNIGPFIYVPLLWMFRDRPVAFGAVLAVGVLHREFTVYVVPVLLAQQWASGALFTWPRVKLWLLAVVVALATWQGVEVLRVYSDPMGPGTRGVLIPSDSGVGAGGLLSRIEFSAEEMPERVSTMMREHFPGLLGARMVRDPIAAQGHDWLFWPFVIALGIGVVTATRRVATSSDNRRSEFPIFLIGVGVLAIVGYVLTRPSDFFLNRYMLLALFLPIGIVSLTLALRPGRWVAAMMIAFVSLMAAGSASDHLTLFERYAVAEEPDELRPFVDALVAKGVDVSIAGYWRAYKITFLAGEKVKVASSDVIRVTEYQELAAARGHELLAISERPCAGGQELAGWFLCPRGEANGR